MIFPERNAQPQRELLSNYLTQMREKENVKL
jgi:hypothetical protein